MASTTVAGFEPQAPALGLALDCTTTAGPIPSDLDPERFGQVIANLVENTLKYAHATVACRPAASTHVDVSVGDDGPGVPEPEQAKVFDRLYTARPAQGRPVGTGLGLGIVRELARAMGGDPAGPRSTPWRTRLRLCVFRRARLKDGVGGAPPGDGGGRLLGGPQR